MGIRKMMDENAVINTVQNINRTKMNDKKVSDKDGDRTKMRRKSISASPSRSRAKSKKGRVPDWNSIHNKQIFSRQPDLAEWDKQKRERQERLFGRSSTKKMSTP